MTTTLTLAELEQATDRNLGPSDWHEITQEQINLFANATGDQRTKSIRGDLALRKPRPMPRKLASSTKLVAEAR